MSSIANSDLPIKYMEASGTPPAISGVPKHHEPSAPISQHASMSPDSSSPVKVLRQRRRRRRGREKNPGLMNEMQIPARTTSSAPRNLDEQKQDQQPHKRDVIAVDVYPIPKSRKETQGPPLVSQTQNPPALPFSVTSMPMSFHQAQPAGGPNPQIQQPHGVAATSLQMPVPVGLPLGNAPQVQQPIFVQGLQPHPIQPQGFMHQGQSLSFTIHLGSTPLTTGQIAPNPHAARYNYNVNPGAQSLSYMDPSAINSLPVNKSSTMIHVVGDQSNFEHNREIHNPVSISSSAVQVTVKPAAASTIDKAAKPSSLNSPSIIELDGAQKHSRSSGESVASLPAVVEQSIPDVVESSVCDSLSSLALTTEESVPTAANVEGRRREPLVRSNSTKNHQKKMGQKGYSRPQNQAVVQPNSMSCLPSRALDHGKLLDGRSTDLNVMLTFSYFLNKLTPQNFGKTFEQMKANIDNARTLAGVVAQIFEKALMKPTFCEMYATLCYHLAGELPDFVEDNEKITFKRLLLNKCQEEFERREEQKEANRADAAGEIKQSPEEREEKRLNAQRRMLGSIRLIGELYKKKMLTERIMHECIKKLLGQYQNPDEEDLESLCTLMSTIGEMIDHPKAKDHMDAYFERMAMLSNNMILSSRIRLMLKDSIDLRSNKWQQWRKVEGPKKMDDVHMDAAQEQHPQANRFARSPSMNQSDRRTPMDFGPRGSAMLSPSTPMGGGSRGLPNQARAFENQDALFDELQQYEPRMMATFDGLPNLSERYVHNSRGDLLARYGTAERIVVPTAYDQVNTQKHNMNFVNKDKVLRDKSLAAIKEYYSARDEREVALCIKELNSPSFHPSMVSYWVNDSFERKDMERDLLAKLLVNLTRSKESILTQLQLVKGFEYVLTTLEDIVNDAPKAAKFLGRIFGKAVSEKVVPLEEIGKLLLVGGEEPERLKEIGLAGDVIGSILETVKVEKGESLLNEIKVSSNLHLEDFRPEDGFRSRILEKFI